MVSVSEESGNGGTFPRQEASNNSTDFPDNNTSYSYRGGFSTSIVDSLFALHGHSDCCALTCCGILLYDRNTFLLTGKRPSWKGRFLGGAVLLAIIVCFVAFAAVSSSSADAVDSNNPEGYDDQADQYTSSPESTEEPDSSRHPTVQDNQTVHGIWSLLMGLLAGLLFYFLYMLAYHRFYARRFLMARMYDERVCSSTASDERQSPSSRTATTTTRLVATPAHADLGEFLKLQEPSIRSATSICGCIPKDAILIVDPSATTNDDDAIDRRKEPDCGSDFCHWIWKALNCLCCGACCGCWCQCLGLCATAQEDRELQRMLPREKFLLDYITFQPFEEYAPKLNALRETKDNNMLKHMEALSQLSKLLVRVLLLFLGCMTVIAFTGVDPSFQPVHLAVVALVLFQAFVIVYFVHWQFYRFDLSLDAVIKYFASGFILCTANAFVYEMLVSTALGAGSSILRLLIALIALMVGRAEEDGGILSGNSESIAASDDIAVNTSDDGSAGQSAPIWLLVLAAFLNAFLVAALVEEVSKYFGFWMVEHPDLLLESDSKDQAGSASQSVTQSAVPSEQRTLRSVGAGITIAMVTTAVGFACCENFMYVFFYTKPSNPTTEITTLIARSIFPVHPLAAAIQSIGVCRRDIEKDSSMRFGKIIFPALVLHGSFDFALMFLELLNRQSSGDNSGNSGTEVGESVDDLDSQDGGAFRSQLPGLVSSVCIVVVGIVYYVIRAIAQRRRLVGLDNSRQGSGEYEQLL